MLQELDGGTVSRQPTVLEEC